MSRAADLLADAAQQFHRCDHSCSRPAKTQRLSWRSLYIWEARI